MGSTGPSVAFGRALAEAGADVVAIGNASASSSMISRDAYARFVHPSNRAMISALRAAGVITMMHICGNLDDRADLVLGEGMGIMSFERLDVPRFKARFGREVCFLGYVGASSTLLRGEPADVLTESVQCIREAGDAGGFILSADCVVPRDTPLANVRAMVEAAERHGQMSALLTTTMPAMRETLAALAAAGLRARVRVAVGGAPVTQEFAGEIEADFYARDAGEAVARAKALVVR